MKYQSIFSGENMESVVNLSSAEFSYRVVKVNIKSDCVTLLHCKITRSLFMLKFIFTLTDSNFFYRTFSLNQSDRTVGYRFSSKKKKVTIKAHVLWERFHTNRTPHTLYIIHERIQNGFVGFSKPPL